MSLVKYIDQVSDFDINPKRKLFGLLWYCKKTFTWTTKIKQSYKSLKFDKRDVQGHIIDKFFAYTMSTYTTII